MTWTEMAAEGRTVEEAMALRGCSRRTAAEGLIRGRAALAGGDRRRADDRAPRPAARALASSYPRLMRSLAVHGRRGVPPREISRPE